MRVLQFLKFCNPDDLADNKTILLLIMLDICRANFRFYNLLSVCVWGGLLIFLFIFGNYSQILHSHYVTT